MVQKTSPFSKEASKPVFNGGTLATQRYSLRNGNCFFSQRTERIRYDERKLTGGSNEARMVLFPASSSTTWVCGSGSGGGDGGSRLDDKTVALRGGITGDGGRPGEVSFLPFTDVVSNSIYNKRKNRHSTT